jgi:NAD-dependent deacetylase
MATYVITPENLQSVREKVFCVLRTARFAVAITGAGISKASGIPLLEASIDGMPLRRMFQQEMFDEHPDLYYDMYRKAMVSWRYATPNRAHMLLAQKRVWVVTQNIDGLHRDVGTEHLIELHGNFRELLCGQCRHIYNSNLAFEARVPCCPTCRQVLKPGIVLEGEEVRHFSRAVDWVGRAEIVFVIGTSLNMVPVQDLPDIADRNGSTVIWINQEAEHLLDSLYQL